MSAAKFSNSFSQQSHFAGVGMSLRRVCTSQPKFCHKPNKYLTTSFRSKVVGFQTQSRAAPQNGVPARKQKFANFDQLLSSSELPILVDFYAHWCGPCLYMSPILQEVSKKMKDEVVIAKVDVDKFPAIASRFNVAALPTMILFKKGEIIDKIEGVMSEQDFRARLSHVISSNKESS